MIFILKSLNKVISKYFVVVGFFESRLPDLNGGSAGIHSAFFQGVPPKKIKLQPAALNQATLRRVNEIIIGIMGI